MNRTLLTLLFTALFLFVGAGLTSCKKITYDLAKSEKSDDAPEYNVKFQQNLSPAEGEVRKAN